MRRHQGMYQERTYHNRILKNNLKTFSVTIRESDLFISAQCDLTAAAYRSTLQNRSYIESYIDIHPNFQTALTPLAYDEFATPIIGDMMIASMKTGVGPMAAVAGAIAQYVGKDLLQYSEDIIIENGGDIFMSSRNDVHVGIFAGNSPLSNHVSLIVRQEEMPLGICTSSGTVGHSLSFGKADAVCVKAKSALLADAAATSLGNMVKTKGDIYRVLEKGMKIDGILGIIIIVADKMGVIGNIELVRG